MRKITLLLGLLAIGFASHAQKARVSGNRELQGKDPSLKADKIDFNNGLEESKGRVVASPSATQSWTGSDWAEKVGSTYYDLQTWGSNMNFIQYYPATGDLSVIWQFGAGRRVGRRTPGYNHWRASSSQWNKADTNQYSIHPGAVGNWNTNNWLGNYRSGSFGWPNLIQSGNKEGITGFVVAPIGSGKLKTQAIVPRSGDYLSSGPNVNSQDTLPYTSKIEGNYSFAASADNNSYMLIASTDTALRKGLLIDGAVNNVLLHHSTDLGNTWATYNIPYLSAAYGIGGIKSTGMAIDAKGDQVVVVAQVLWASPRNGLATYLYKSSYRGMPGTWSSKLIASRTLADTSFRMGDSFAFSTDGSFSVVIDNNNLVHVTSHAGYATNDPNGDDPDTFFRNGGFSSPVPGALYYWNDAMPEGSGWKEIATVLDINKDGTINTPAYSAANGAGPYPVAGLSMSTISVDQSNNLYVTYSAAVEETQATSSPNTTRDLYVTASYDNGNNWTYPINVAGRLNIVNCFTSDDGSSGAGLYEEAWPVAVKRIGADRKLHITFMSDDIAGMARAGTNSLSALLGWPVWRGNDINYVGIKLEDIEGTYLRANFPKQICAGAQLPIQVTSPTNRLCIYGPLTNTSVFKAQLDTTNTGKFDPAKTILLGTFTGDANGGVINATFPANYNGFGKVRVIVENGNPNATPPLYNYETGEHDVTITNGVAITPGAITNINSIGQSIPANGTICSNHAAVFAVPSVPNATQFEWSVSPDTAGTIERGGDYSRGGNFANAIFNNRYNGPVTVSVKALNPCGNSNVSTFTFNLGGAVTRLDQANLAMVTTGTGGVWQRSDTIGTTYTAVTPAQTGSTLPLATADPGYYRYAANGCASNVVYWAGYVKLSPAVLAKQTKLYPNPAKDYFSLAVEKVDGQAEVSVFNALGQLVNQKTVALAEGNSITNFSTEGMSKGLYFVKLTVAGTSTTKRLVIE